MNYRATFNHFYYFIFETRFNYGGIKVTFAKIIFYFIFLTLLIVKNIILPKSTYLTVLVLFILRGGKTMEMYLPLQFNKDIFWDV